ncbi:MAG: ATP synthase subunit I [Firmicutes bacterium]|nr:ATP synthase subunit I [Bacillota bacterium]
MVDFSQIDSVGVKGVDIVAAKVRQIIGRTTLLALTLAVFALIFSRGSAALGVLIGAIISVLNFRLLANKTRQVLENTNPGAAQVQAFVGYLVRYLLYAGVLYVVSLNPEVDFFAAIVGILLVKAVIIIEAIAVSVRQATAKLLSARWERGD